jgi:hypothetical protein
VRKNGSGYYLVVHPLHPAVGRPDFVPWLLGKQHEALVDLPAPVPGTKPKQATCMASQSLKTAFSLRQMSRDLGAVAAGKPVSNSGTTMGMLANLGIPVPGGVKQQQATRMANRQPSDGDDEVRLEQCQ